MQFWGALMSTYLCGEHHAIKPPARIWIISLPLYFGLPPAPDVRLAAPCRRDRFFPIYRSPEQFFGRVGLSEYCEGNRLLHLFNIARGNVITRRRARMGRGAWTRTRHSVAPSRALPGLLMNCRVYIRAYYNLQGELTFRRPDFFFADKRAVIYFGNDIGNAACFFVYKWIMLLDILSVSQGLPTVEYTRRCIILKNCNRRGVSHERHLSCMRK